MLLELRIKNFVLIDTLELGFGRGLNILTGETGAGKSILIDALGLVLGDRVSEEHLRSGQESGEVEATFSIAATKEAHLFLKNAGIEPEDEIIVRRLFYSSGRAKCFVNGVSVTLSFLKKLGDMLVDMNGQHAHQALLHRENHIRVLDAFEGTEPDVLKLKKEIAELREKEKELQLVREREDKKEGRLDMLRFQLEEITEAGLSPGEDEQLTNEKQLLQHAEQRSLISREAYEMIYSGEGAARDRLNIALDKIEEILNIDPSLEKIAQDLKETLYSIEDISTVLRDYMDKVSFDPERLQEIEDRLADINRLKRKYGRTIKDILTQKEEIERELSEFTVISKKGAALEKLVESLRDAISRQALALAKRREKGAGRLGKQVERQLRDLKMDKVTFVPRFFYEEDEEGFIRYNGRKVRLGSTGIGTMTFYLSSNAGEEVKPLSRIASGGELSRIMLAVKNVLLGKNFVPVLIFDEVDSGIGGGVADVVGEKIKRLAKEHQIFCVTHLPQVASRGDTHFFVSKKVSGKRTTLTIRELDKMERVEEIARMAGGVKITETTRQHAREMIERVGE